MWQVFADHQLKIVLIAQPKVLVGVKMAVVAFEKEKSLLQWQIVADHQLKIVLIAQPKVLAGIKMVVVAVGVKMVAVAFEE